MPSMPSPFLPATLERHAQLGPLPPCPRPCFPPSMTRSRTLLPHALCLWNTTQAHLQPHFIPKPLLPTASGAF